jgi:hypothetical protein
MAFQVSPGVNVSEIDQTTSAPAVATTEGAIAGVFRWGPLDQRVLVDSEGTLVSTFGKPTSNNAETFFTAANFLAYGNKLYVVRSGNTAYNTTDPLKTATANTLALSASYANGDVNDSLYPAAVGSNNTLQELYAAQLASVKNANEYEDALSNLANHPGIHFGARYPGELGNSLKISICPSSDAFQSTINVASVVNTSIESESSVVSYTYSNVAQSSTDGSGTGATFDVTRYANGDYTVAVNSGGTGHANDDTITINGDLLGGANTTHNVTFVATTGAADTIIASVANTTGTANDYSTVTKQFDIAVGSSQGFISIDEPLSNTGANADYGIFTDIVADFVIGDIITVGNNTIGTSDLKLKSFGTVESNTTHTRLQVNFENRYQQRAAFSTSSVTRKWEYYAVVDKAPGSTFAVISGDHRDANNALIKDGMHIVISDEDGQITGAPGTLLEVYNNISRASDAKTEEGDDNYYRNILRDQSLYVWSYNHISGLGVATADSIATSTAALPTTISFTGGDDGRSESAIDESAIMAGYDYFVNSEDVDISLILCGKARGGSHGELIPNYIISNIAEQRKDCMVFVSPDRADTVNAGAATVDNVIQFRQALINSSYAVMDSGYKYQYDRYNDVYRNIPLNGDIAGLAVRTDADRDPWFSPAGLQRGSIRNLVRLTFNPSKSQRDQLYKEDVNPVVTIPGQGTILFGDKTLLGRPSPFDRINVRRLFIVLEKTVSAAAKFTLFEFNDEFTRAQFKNLVEPFLRDVQGRRGIYDFRVVCDETNNGEAVVDANQFVGDIYIKPAKSINFIQLNFVAVRSGVEFSEIVGVE